MIKKQSLGERIRNNIKANCIIIVGNDYFKNIINGKTLSLTKNFYDAQKMSYKKAQEKKEEINFLGYICNIIMDD